MSSPQVIDSEKMASQVSRFLNDARREKQRKAFETADAKRLAAIAPKDGLIDMTNAEAQKGRVLSRIEFVKRLESITPNIFCDRSINDKKVGAVYYIDGVSNADNLNPRYRGSRHIAGFPWDFISEHDLAMNKEVAYGEDGRADTDSAGRIPGWRSVLARLIKARIITVSQAEKTFAISRGRESERWWMAFQ